MGVAKIFFTGHHNSSSFICIWNFKLISYLVQELRGWTDHPTIHPSIRPSIHPTLWIIGIRGKSKNRDCRDLNGGVSRDAVWFKCRVTHVELLRVALIELPTSSYYELLTIELGVTINSFQVKQFLIIF